MRELEGVRRIVVKVGTNTLCDPDGRPDEDLLASLAADIAWLRAQGYQILVVSSGAIGSGRNAMRMPDLPQDIPIRQALAAIGQPRLMAAWDKALRKHKIHAAQVLLTHHTFDQRRRYNHLRDCLEAVLAMGACPILNENDTVSIREIDASFGDNDHLGALVAAKMEADLFLVLSDVAGLYTKAPHLKGAEPVAEVPEVTDKVLKMATGRAAKGGRGGMHSKLEAARMLTEAGIPVLIAYGRHPQVLRVCLDPETDPPIGTWFHAVGRQDGWERWLRAARPQGRIFIDAGAAEALRSGYHLLPAGVTHVEGPFPVESVVDLVFDGDVVARAVSKLSSEDLQACMGMRSPKARKALGVEGSVNVTRKGRLVLL